MQGVTPSTKTVRLKPELWKEYPIFKNRSFVLLPSPPAYPRVLSPLKQGTEVFGMVTISPCGQERRQKRADRKGGGANCPKLPGVFLVFILKILHFGKLHGPRQTQITAQPTKG